MLGDQLRRQVEVEVGEREVGVGMGLDRDRSCSRRAVKGRAGQNCSMAHARPRAAASPQRPPAPTRQAVGARPRDGQAGPVRDIDLALHLPLRYEDETR
jgi:hypothetical protein